MIALSTDDVIFNLTRSQEIEMDIPPVRTIEKIAYTFRTVHARQEKHKQETVIALSNGDVTSGLISDRNEKCIELSKETVVGKIDWGRHLKPQLNLVTQAFSGLKITKNLELV
jgi:hypothetical protein